MEMTRTHARFLVSPLGMHLSVAVSTMFALLLSTCWTRSSPLSILVGVPGCLASGGLAYAGTVTSAGVVSVTSGGTPEETSWWTVVPVPGSRLANDSVWFAVMVCAGTNEKNEAMGSVYT